MKTRNVIYMIYNEKEQSVTSMGIEFAEFTASLSHELNHILLLASGLVFHSKQWTIRSYQS